MSITDNDPDHDTGMLQMGLVVPDAKAEGNGDFNGAVDLDHESSESPPLIDPSFNESTLQRNAVADVLMGLNDPVPFTVGSSRKSRTDQSSRTSSGSILQAITINKYSRQSIQFE